MDIKQKPEFVDLLKQVMGRFAKPLPETAIVTAWWETLQPYSMQIVATAFAQYCDENSDFSPVPNAIARRCKLLDGRPGEEEAWANALLSQNETDTVVWTSEAAEAFQIASSILALGDEVGARKAFKEAYVRLVGAARLSGAPAQWQVSLGWDSKKRAAVISKARNAGLLPAPIAAALLPSPDGSDQVSESNAQRGMKTVKEALAKLVPASEKLRQRREAEHQAQREAEAARKRELAEQAATYRQERSSRVAES